MSVKKLVLILAGVAAVLGVLRYRQVQEQREAEAEIWAEATDPI